jgi:hypothetical protein
MKSRSASRLVSDAKREASDVKHAKDAMELSAAKAAAKASAAYALELEERIRVLRGIGCKADNRNLLNTRKSKPSGVAAIVPATDWHVEETIYKDAVNGKNEFNLSIAEERIGRFYSKILELIEWQNHLSPVVELWHPLLGDLMSGHIHEELLETNSLSPVETVVFLRDMLCSGIDLLLRETKLPISVPTCVGNHGRTTTKKRIKTSCRNSYEWLLYTMLAKHYEKARRVRFSVGTGYHNTQEIMGRKVRFHHGDGLRYMGGVGGISIPVNKSIAQWDKVSPADFDIFGHWHTHLVHYPKWVSCGSLMGYSEYSVEIKADFQHPTQTFIVIDRKYGLVQATPIFLTKPRRG